MKNQRQQETPKPLNKLKSILKYLDSDAQGLGVGKSYFKSFPSKNNRFIVNPALNFVNTCTSSELPSPLHCFIYLI